LEQPVTVVHGKVNDQPYSPSGLVIAATLVDLSGVQRIGYVESTETEITTGLTTKTDVAGAWSLELPANDSISTDYGDTLWRIAEGVSSDWNRQVTTYILVPDSGSSQWLGALRAAVPGGSGPVLSYGVQSVDGLTGAVDLSGEYVPTTGGTVTGPLAVDPHGAPGGHPIGLAHAAASLSVLSSFEGGEDNGSGTDTTGRLNLYSYQRADVDSFGETIRHFAMRKDSKQMEAWYFPSGGYDGNRDPVGSFKPVVWAGAHWEANNHASNHKHWSVETPDSTGAIQTRFEVRWGNPTNDAAIAGLDKTMIATNLADFVVRCSNGQELRIASPNGQEKTITFSRDAEGDPQYRRWKLRSTDDSESGANAGSNFQLVRYDDAGALVDTPVVVSRATGNVTLGPGLVARRASATVSSLSMNTTSLGSGVGVVAIGNANTVPSTNPTAGGVLYAEGGALKWRGSSGTVTTIAPA
jgi:hypothetical protein